MAAGMPGEIITAPGARIVFNAPFSEKNVYNIRVLNDGAHRIGWAIKTTNMQRINVNPPAGVLDAKESAMLTISCEPFDFNGENSGNDRISFEWTNAPDGAAKQFRREWFQGDGMVRRKNLPIEYNP